MQLDRQTAREMAEAILWWEARAIRLWNATLGHVLGYHPPREDDPEEATVVLVEEYEE